MQKSQCAYFCGYLRIFDGYLRIFAGYGWVPFWYLFWKKIYKYIYSVHLGSMQLCLGFSLGTVCPSRRRIHSEYPANTVEQSLFCKGECTCNIRSALHLTIGPFPMEGIETTPCQFLWCRCLFFAVSVAPASSTPWFDWGHGQIQSGMPWQRRWKTLD